MQIGSCRIVYGNDVDTLHFDWGNVKLLSCPGRRFRALQLGYA